VSQTDILWSLVALNDITAGGLTKASIESLIGAVKFVEGYVVAEDFLHAFELVDIGSGSDRD